MPFFDQGPRVPEVQDAAGRMIRRARKPKTKRSIRKTKAKTKTKTKTERRKKRKTEMMILTHQLLTAVPFQSSLV